MSKRNNLIDLCQNGIYIPSIKKNGGYNMKRQKMFPVLFTSAEWDALELLQTSYSSTGAHVSKAFLVRYGLKRLPHQNPLIPFP